MQHNFRDKRTEIFSNYFLYIKVKFKEINKSEIFTKLMYKLWREKKKEFFFSTSEDKLWQATLFNKYFFLLTVFRSRVYP